jgi:pimeloyl-ACP methyl ester carboxylesterase
VTDLAVDIVGEGETALLVHGSGFRDFTWADQMPLAVRYRLVLPFRRGYGASPDADPDFEVDARDIVSLLEERANVVGHSYGAVGSLVAAGLRPEAFRSLTVIEPPAFGVARGDPAVEELVARVQDVRAGSTGMTTAEFGRAFTEAIRFERPVEDPPPEILSAVESLRRERPPWEAEIPFEQLDGIPVLVVSGGWHPAFDAVCDVIEERARAERAVLPGAGHGAQHAPGFNERLVSFWKTAARRHAGRP